MSNDDFATPFWNHAQRFVKSGHQPPVRKKIVLAQHGRSKMFDFYDFAVGADFDSQWCETVTHHPVPQILAPLIRIRSGPAAMVRGQGPSAW
jgi:hypothetical protein